MLTGHLENIRQNFHVDVATGDPVTPSSIDYSYKRLLDDGVIRFKAYNLETVLAEKLQTILARSVLNSRCKDFYDIFIIGKLRSEQVDLADLKSAFEKTMLENQHLQSQSLLAKPLLPARKCSKKRSPKSIFPRRLKVILKKSSESFEQFGSAM